MIENSPHTELFWQSLESDRDKKRRYNSGWLNVISTNEVRREHGLKLRKLREEDPIEYASYTRLFGTRW